MGPHPSVLLVLLCFSERLVKESLLRDQRSQSTEMAMLMCTQTFYCTLFVGLPTDLNPFPFYDVTT